MRYGIISDTHIKDINDEKAKQLIKALKKAFHNVDEIIHAGDISNLDFIKELNKIAPVKFIAGEHDKFTDPKRFLKIENPQYNIGVIHELPSNIEEFSKRENLIGGILIHGHTHTPLIKGTKFNTLLLNPGSPTFPKAPEKIAGFKEPIARKSVLSLEINQKGIIKAFIINLKL
jgi:hypothetical protein